MPPSHRLSLFLLLGGGCAEPTLPIPTDFSDPILAETMDALAARELEKVGGSLVVGIFEGGERVWFAGYGALPQGGLPSGDTPYRIGSITKVITAVAVMQLHERGLLDIDAPLEAQLPGFSIQSRFADSTPITPRHVLTHHAGLPSDLLPGMYAQEEAPYLTERTAMLADEFVSHPPGEWWSYSNTGFTVLGHLVEVTSGQPFAEYVAENILAPCQMKGSTFSLEASIPGTLGGEVASHLEGDAQTDTPAGGMVSTLNDLGRFATGLLYDGECGGGLLLQPESIAEMFTPTHHSPLDFDLVMGLGFQLEPASAAFAGQDLVLHDGDTILFHARMHLVPDLGIATVALTNELEAGDLVTEAELLALGMAIGAATGEPVLGAYTEPATVKGPSPYTRSALERRAGTYGTQIGLMELRPSGGGFRATLMGFRIKLVPTEEGTFRVRPVIAGATLPFFLENMEMSLQEVEDRWVMAARGAMIGHTWVPLGARFQPRPAEGEWADALGEYVPTHSQGDRLRLASAQLTDREGYLQLTTEIAEAGERVELSFGLIPQEPGAAITGGTSRRAGETVRLTQEDGDTILYVQGTRMRRVKASGCSHLSPQHLPLWALPLVLAALRRGRRP